MKINGQSFDFCSTERAKYILEQAKKAYLEKDFVLARQWLDAAEAILQTRLPLMILEGQE